MYYIYIEGKGREAEYLERVNSEEQDNDFLSEPLALFGVMRNAAAVGDVVEEGPDVLELGFGDGEVAQAAEHLGAVGQVRPVAHLDEQCGILRGEAGLALALGVAPPLESLYLVGGRKS